MGSFRIVVADDHPVFRLGLSALLASHPGWDVCGEASDGRGAIEMCRRLRPDLLVLDIGMPYLNGLDAARQILASNPNQMILVVTDVDREDVIRGCLEAGVRGWMFKSDDTDDLLASVEAIQRHQRIFSPHVTNLLARHYLRTDRLPHELTIPELTVREREVLQLVCEGSSTKEVATMLDVTVKTADTHRSNIMRKLGLHSVAELVLYSVRNGIVQITPPLVDAGLGEAAGRYPLRGFPIAALSRRDGPVTIRSVNGT